MPDSQAYRGDLEEAAIAVGDLVCADRDDDLVDIALHHGVVMRVGDRDRAIHVPVGRRAWLDTRAGRMSQAWEGAAGSWRKTARSRARRSPIVASEPRGTAAWRAWHRSRSMAFSSSKSCAAASGP